MLYNVGGDGFYLFIFFFKSTNKFENILNQRIYIHCFESNN